MDPQWRVVVSGARRGPSPSATSSGPTAGASVPERTQGPGGIPTVPIRAPALPQEGFGSGSVLVPFGFRNCFLRTEHLRTILKVSTNNIIICIHNTSNIINIIKSHQLIFFSKRVLIFLFSIFPTISQSLFSIHSKRSKFLDCRVHWVSF